MSVPQNNSVPQDKTLARTTPGTIPHVGAAPLFGLRCPRCDDRLQLYHTHSERRATHFLGCVSFPACTYTTAYDTRMHELLEGMQARLVWLTAQYCWLLGEVEALAARMQEVQP